MRAIRSQTPGANGKRKERADGHVRHAYPIAQKRMLVDARLTWKAPIGSAAEFREIVIQIVLTRRQTPQTAAQMEQGQMNTQQLEAAEQALAASGKGLPKTDESRGPRVAPSSTAAKTSVGMRKIAISLSQFLKKQRSSPGNYKKI